MLLHEEGGALLGEQPPVPHDAHSVRVPGLLDIVRRDDHAHALQDIKNIFYSKYIYI